MRKYLMTFMFLLIFISNARSGQFVYNFKLKDIENQLRQYSELAGDKLTIIDFWATWCSPCIKVIPKLNTIYDKYQNEGVQFIGLNIDSPKNDAKIKPFVKAHKILYPVLKDPNSQVASRLNIINVPTLLIINSKNEIVYRHQGYHSGDEHIIETEILKLLEESNND